MEFRSFELNPNAPAQQEGNLEEALARKYGVSLEQARAMNARVVDAAAGEGLRYRYDIAKRGNTFDAHRLIHLAATVGLQPAMKERLLAAYFIEGRAIGDRNTLVELAGEAGIDSEWSVGRSAARGDARGARCRLEGRPGLAGVIDRHGGGKEGDTEPADHERPPSDGVLT